jgi:hypothetical protein
MEGLMQFGGLVLMVGMTYAPVVGLLELLNLRDRRESRLLGTVMKELAARHFSGRIAVRAHCALLSRRSVVRLDMRACWHDEIWLTVARLSRTLPPAARLLVDATVDPQCPAPVTLAVPSQRPFAYPSQPFAVTR